MSLQIAVENVSRSGHVPASSRLRAWAQAALKDRRTDAELTLRVVDEEESAELNRRYRGKSGPTNVLSFPAGLPAGVPVPALGDIVICAPVVSREAREQGKPEEAHWAHMVVHGCLHLLGYDHQTDAQAGEMEGLERTILERFGIPDPYATR